MTSDGGLLLVRELDERLGLSELISEHLTDSRGKNTQLPMADLLRQAVYSRLAGYEDVNDAERLSQDPTFRLIGSERIWERGAALTSRVQSFETELLTQAENLSGLAAINRELIARAETIESSQRVVLDTDSTEIPVYGQQEQSAYNGHFETTCYHPLLLFNGEGDCLAGKLRPGNVHSAEDWAELLLPEIERQQELGKEVVFRADAAFAKPEIYEALEERGVKYAIRIPANDSLERDIAELLTRPVGRPSHKPVVWYKGFLYQAASWKTARRVVAKVEFHCGELFPRVGFIVTNLETPSRAVVRFYNKRGTAEQWIKEGKVPEIGITGTPVIDTPTGTMYLVAKTKQYDSLTHTTTFYQTLHALDIKTGLDKVAPVPISATYPGNGTGSVGGILTFDPLVEAQRSSLLLLKGQVFIAWASHCDLGSYHGYIMSFNEATLVRSGLYVDTPNGYEGGFWGGGAGPSADSGGSIYVSTGNGKFRWRSRFRRQRYAPYLADHGPIYWSE